MGKPRAQAPKSPSKVKPKTGKAAKAPVVQAKERVLKFQGEGLDALGQRQASKASKKTNAEVPGGDSSLAVSPAHCHNC